MIAVQMNVVDHPLVKVRLSVIRDASTSDAMFRSALRDVSWMLLYEATRDLPTADVPLRTPVAETIGTTVTETPLLVPVLRAGLGMVDAALALLPAAHLGFVGLARDEQTLQPTTYLESLPADLGGRPVIVLDPMLATGGSLLRTVELIAARGAGPITCVCVLAAPEGIALLEGSELDLRLVVAAVDERLDDRGFIVPGLGDAGDRQFGVR